MTSPEATLAQPPRRAPSSSWIESPGFDLAFFILAPLAGLAVLAAYPIGGPAIALAAAALIGGPHYLASYTFFFWEDAGQHHRKRWVLHFVIPVGIVAAVALIAVFRIPGILIFVIYFWNAWHVARQSCGILAVYRLRGGYSGERHKRIVNAAILSVSLHGAWNLDWYVELYALLVIPIRRCCTRCGLAPLVASVRRSWRLPCAHTHAARRPARLRAFLVTSLTLFHPTPVGTQPATGDADGAFHPVPS
jgi:hypothetical protein